jgi:hypothetical protein
MQRMRTTIFVAIGITMKPFTFLLIHGLIMEVWEVLLARMGSRSSKPIFKFVI